MRFIFSVDIEVEGFVAQETLPSGAGALFLPSKMVELLGSSAHLNKLLSLHGSGCRRGRGRARGCLRLGGPRRVLHVDREASSTLFGSTWLFQSIRQSATCDLAGAQQLFPSEPRVLC